MVNRRYLPRKQQALVGRCCAEAAFLSFSALSILTQMTLLDLPPLGIPCVSYGLVEATRTVLIWQNLAPNLIWYQM